MPFPHVTAPHPRKEDSAQAKPAPVAPKEEIKLPESYFQELLDLPSCKINGHCDRCGRCEH